MFVLKYKYGGPADFMEYPYQETVHVKNKIAVVRSEVSKLYMLGQGFDLLGEIPDESKLEAFLASLETGVTEEVGGSDTLASGVVKLADIVDSPIKTPAPVPATPALVVSKEEKPAKNWWRE